ncbi:MAG: hypothetical protein ACU0FH_06900 [Heliomarina sp.]|uniref:hypothetical protein n=1 Tax=Heliomarina TaxID=2917553 RepID=UPI001EE39E49|nr:hypothetical protein [Heliomarina baculiformis]
MPNLFVVDPDPVIALDLSEALAEFVPDGVVHVFSSIADAHDALVRIAKPWLTIVSVPSSELRSPRVKETLHVLSERTVVVAEQPEYNNLAVPNSILVQRPFTTDMISSAIVNLGAPRR